MPANEHSKAFGKNEERREGQWPMISEHRPALATYHQTKDTKVHEGNGDFPLTTVFSSPALVAECHLRFFV